MSEPGEHDWFGGARAAESAAPTRTVAVADSGEPAPTVPGAVPMPGPVPESIVPAPVPELVAALAEAANAAPSPPEPETEPQPETESAETVPKSVTDPETDSRVRLQALTGGLADLSDALAAIGVESVALRSTGPASPPPAPVTTAADFRVRCPDCGPQYVAVSDVRFVETGDGAEANRYLFTCPACGARVRRPAGPELAEILKSSGVATLALRRGPGQAL